MTQRLEGKTALITGGTTGIGFTTAKQLLEEGARVAIVGQNESRVAAAKASLGNEVVAMCADVSSPEEMTRVATQLKQDFSKLDIVFANAGIAKPMPLAEIDESNIDSQLNVNLKGVIYTVQKTLPLMNNPSSIILTSTTMTHKGISGMSVYAATKAAVRSLARTMSSELIDRGIRVNVISPGLIETPIYQKLGLPQEAVEQWAGELLKTVPAARFGQTSEIAKAVAFLASDDSSYMLGENVTIDGGVATL